MAQYYESILFEVLGSRFSMDSKAFGKWLRRLWKQGRVERIFGSDGEDGPPLASALERLAEKSSLPYYF